MKNKYFNNSKIFMSVSLVVVFSILMLLIMPIRIGAAGAPPDITVKLNDSEVAYNHDIIMQNGDKLKIIADFKTMDVGDTYEVDLPAVFLNLNEETIREANKDILEYVELSITKDENGKQKIKITFLQNVAASSFSFWAILDVSKEDINEKQEIIIDGDLIISIVPTEPSKPPGSYVGPQNPPPPLPEGDADLKKNVINQVSEKMFLEDTNINNALYYKLRLNLAQFNRPLTGIMRDSLPTGMKLFIPSAPNCGRDSYESAFASFSIYFMSTLIEGDSDDNCYVNISSYPGETAKYVGYVNAIEVSQGRAGTYTIDNLNPVIKLPAYLANSLRNAEGKYIAYDGADLGYRIDESGVIHIMTIDKNHPDVYEKKHTGPWTNSSLYIPLYRTPDCETAIYHTPLFQRTTILQELGNLNENVNREYLGSSADGTIISYRWSYKYNGAEEFILIVKNDSATDIDSFEIEMKGSESSFSYGKALFIQPSIYFDQSKWDIPSTGEITFRNTVTYEDWQKSADTKYVYDLGSSGTVVAEAGKTVDDEKKNHLDPDSGSTIQEYALMFKKLGNETIPAGNFEVFDRLDGNLVFVNKSLKIYKEDTGWVDITDHDKDTDTSAVTTTADGVNLKAYYDSNLHRIVIVNVGVMNFTGRIKVEFKTDLADDVEYGTKIINYFGESVETFVSHTIAIKKIDSNNNAIVSSPAEFLIQYTTDSDLETAQLHDLTDSKGNPVGTLLTDNSGIAQALYALEADNFYLKITEIAAPDGYVKITEPIWIKAVRDSVNQKMNYTLVSKIDGVVLITGEQGLVTVMIENEEFKPEPIEVIIEANKIAHGKPLGNNQFDFAVYEGETKVATGKNTADGKIIFSAISYDAPGIHFYKIKEISVNIPNWIMDNREFIVKVEVTEQDGILTATVVYPEEGITFINEYTKDETPKTSDNGNIRFFTIIFVISFGTICFLSKRRTNMFTIK
jgi:streptococcal pilin isopeptide linkage domain